MNRYVKWFEAGEFPTPPIAKLLNMKLTSLKEGEAVFQIEVDERFANPMGTLHGGIIVSVADSAMGMAYASTLDDDESFTTLELKNNYLKPVWKGTLTATGKLIKRGKSIGIVECHVTDEEGSLVAFAVSTCMTLSGEKAQGR